MTAIVATTPEHSWRVNGRRQRMIPDAETAELFAYQRVSTFAKTLDDKEPLLPWKAWMTLRGAQKDSTLMWKAVHAESTPRGVIDQLAELGGAGEARDRGKDRHQILMMALTGATLPTLPPEARIELDALLRLIESLGRVIAVEAPVVCDEWRLAGSCDLILEDSDGRTIVADFKTGKNVERLSASIQLIAYARSHYWDFEHERRLGLVAINQPRLMVIHAPQSGAAPIIVDLDVEQAKRWAELANAVKQARKQAGRG